MAIQSSGVVTEGSPASDSGGDEGGDEGSSDLFSRADELLAGDSSDEPADDPVVDDDSAPSKTSNKRGPKDDARAEKDAKAKSDKAREGDEPEQATKDGKPKSPIPDGFVPKSVFESRLAEVTSQKRGLREANGKLSKEVAELKASSKLLHAQARHYKEMLQKGVKFDPTQDELLQARLREQAGELQRQVDEEHQKSLEGMSEEELVEAEGRKLALEVDLALANAQGAIDYPELVARLKDRKRSRGKSVAKVAEELIAEKEAVWRTRFNLPGEQKTTAGTKAQPKAGAGAGGGKTEGGGWPSTAKARAGGNTGARQDISLNGMLKRLDELNAGNG